MDYSIVVVASASDSSPLQPGPYSGARSASTSATTDGTLVIAMTCQHAAATGDLAILRRPPGRSLQGVFIFIPAPQRAAKIAMSTAEGR